jgi:3-methylfumaryl-CoA hydratase
MSKNLTAWIGRSETLRDEVTAAPVRGLNATLDHPSMTVDHGLPLFPLWHWLYFLPQHRQSEIGPDGHARRGGFLPPVPLPRRMWAGGRFEFRAPVKVGDAVERTSTIADVTPKEGRTGSLVFVTVRHELRCNGAPDPAIVDYDRRYVTEVEGYPGLIVHGPLIATLLMDLLRREAPEAQVAGFRFKAVRPTFDLHPFKVNGRREGREVKLWAQDHEGWLTMDAVATLKD